MTCLKPRSWVVLLILGAAWLACRSEDPSAPPAPGGQATPNRESTALETEVIDEETIATVQETPGATRPSSSDSRPCGWSRRWERAGLARPLLPGPSVSQPRRVRGGAPELPPVLETRSGAPVLEAVVDEEGRVEEIHFIQGFRPPWPEGEAAIGDALRQWRYEPSRLKGKPVPVCITVTIAVNWDDAMR